MNAYQRAVHYLKNGKPYQKEGYKKIDELIEPLCLLFNENGYITLHSCSAHIEEEKKGLQWYIAFVATKPISIIKKIVSDINKKYGYKIEVCDERKPGKHHCKLTRKWVIQYIIWDLNTRKQLIEINKNIYNEFKLNLIEKRGYYG